MAGMEAGHGSQEGQVTNASFLGLSRCLVGQLPQAIRQPCKDTDDVDFDL